MSEAVIPSATPTPITAGPDGGAPNPSPAAPAAQAPQAGDWMSGLNDDMKGYVQNKGFKDPASVLESYRNFEKLMGAPKDKLVRLPDKDDAPEWGDIYKRLGTPEKPEDYKFQLDNAVDAKWAQTAFHKAGLTAKQAENLAKEWSGYLETTTKAQQEQFQTKLNEEAAGLKKEWGLAHDQNLEKAQVAAKTLGITGEQIDALEQTLGYAGVMKFMHSLGAKLGEHNFVGGQGQNGFGALTPEAASSKIQALKNDPAFVQKFLSGDVTAREEMERLHKFAYGQ